jgi:sulfatase maturation enzyme AslB (radical SAM superfamily)
MIDTMHNLIIEVTRRCNFSCDHCLRGDAQPVDLSPEVPAALFAGLSYVSSITFTGGEPGLVPGVIESVIDEAEKAGTDIGSFYIATNGSQASDEFLHALLRLWLYCSDNGEGEDMMSGVDISQTDFHDYEGQSVEAIRRLTAFRFARLRGRLDNRYIIAEGRGSDVAYGDARTVKPATWDSEMVEQGTIDETVYINVHGDVISECDFSYDSQQIHKDGNILTDTWAQIIENNKRHSE